MRIHIYDNDREYSDHAYYFVAEHPELTTDEFERLLRAWVAYRKEEALEGLRLAAIVLPVELSPGLAAYPTGISSIAEFIDHVRHAPAVGGLSEAAHAAVQTLGEELVLKLSALLDAERRVEESELRVRVAAAVEGAQLPESSPAWSLPALPEVPDQVNQRLASDVKGLKKALNAVDPDALWAYVNGGVKAVERHVALGRAVRPGVAVVEEQKGGGR